MNATFRPNPDFGPLRRAIEAVRRFGLEALDHPVTARDFIHPTIFSIENPQGLTDSDKGTMSYSCDFFGSYKRAQTLMTLPQDQWPLRHIELDMPEEGHTWSALGLSQLYISGVLQCLNRDSITLLIDLNILLAIDGTFLPVYTEMPLPMLTFKDYHRRHWDPDLIGALRYWDQCFYDVKDAIHELPENWPYVRFPL